MADGGACSVCGYAMVLTKGDVWRCSSCGRGADGSPRPEGGLTPDVERVVRAAQRLLTAVERREADEPQDWLDHACGECVGWETNRGAGAELCARHEMVAALRGGEKTND